MNMHDSFKTRTVSYQKFSLSLNTFVRCKWDEKANNNVLFWCRHVNSLAMDLVPPSTYVMFCHQLLLLHYCMFQSKTIQTTFNKIVSSRVKHWTTKVTWWISFIIILHFIPLPRRRIHQIIKNCKFAYEWISSTKIDYNTILCHIECRKLN